MFTFLPIAVSLALARWAASTPVSRAACNPSPVGVGISIARGNLEVGYASSVVDAPIISQPLTTTKAEFVGETPTIINGGFVLKDVNQDSEAPGLYLTWVNSTIKLETLVTPEDGKQGWGFVCSTCNAPSGVKEGGVIASACNVVSGWTGQCLQMANTVGDALTVANCANLGSASQSFDVYMA